MLIFGTTEHVITRDGEWVSVRSFSPDHSGPLLCGSCHTPVVVIQNVSGKNELVHQQCTTTDIGRSRHCSYAVRLSRPMNGRHSTSGEVWPRHKMD